MFSIYNSLFLVILSISLTTFHHSHCAPRVVRDEGLGNQLEFPDSDTPKEVNIPRPQSKGFIEIIIDMIKRLLGWDDKTTIVRQDGTVEWVDNGGGNFLARIGRKILSIINKLLNTFMVETPRYDIDNAKATIFNELEKEGIHLNNG